MDENDAESGRQFQLKVGMKMTMDDNAESLLK
jgi:hypothetical protein